MRAIVVLLALAAALGLSGCVVYTIADTAVSVTSTVVKTTVDVTAGAIETVAGSSSKSDEKLDCDDEDNKDKDACKKTEKPAS
jgi:hypothetical protein